MNGAWGDDIEITGTHWNEMKERLERAIGMHSVDEFIRRDIRADAQVDACIRIAREH